MVLKCIYWVTMEFLGPYAAFTQRRRLYQKSTRPAVKVQANLFERIVRVAKSYANAFGMLNECISPLAR